MKRKRITLIPLMELLRDECLIDIHRFAHLFHL